MKTVHLKCTVFFICHIIKIKTGVGFLINTMADLKIGKSGIVDEINLKNHLKSKLMDMGLVKGTKIKCVLESPGGEISAYLIRGAVIAIRREDAENVLVKFKVGEM